MSAEIESTSKVLARLDKGVALSAVLKDLVRKTHVPGDGVIEVPARKPPSLEQQTAMQMLPVMVSKAIEATPTERRQLTEYEIAVLMEEREKLDAVRKVIDERLADQKVAVFNHLDIELEQAPGFDPDTLEVDEKGHYIVRGRLETPGSKDYVRQLREGSPAVTAESLRAVVDMDEDAPEGEGFTHEDWLACTTPVRVLDEAKVALHMRKKPTLMVEALRRAIVPGKSTTAHTLG